MLDKIKEHYEYLKENYSRFLISSIMDEVERDIYECQERKSEFNDVYRRLVSVKNTINKR